MYHVQNDGAVTEGRYVTLTVHYLFTLQSDGTLLATGSYDGFARIWTKDGMEYQGAFLY